MTTVGIILAAGRSLRFGTDNKLLAAFNNRPLCSYAATAMRDAKLDHRIVVRRDASIDPYFNGFDRIKAAGTQSDSLRAGIEAAITREADYILVALADMPFVTGDLLNTLLAQHPDRLAAATDGARISVPALFAKACFKELLDIKGDKGARDILQNPSGRVLIDCPPRALFDCDIPEDFAAYSQLIEE